MKILLQLTLLLGLAITSTGCATPYMTDRKRDAADIFTLTFGFGAGAKAKIGPAQTGLLAEMGNHGLRGGTFVASCSSLPGEIDFNFLGAGMEAFSGYPEWITVRDRHKDICSETHLIPISFWPSDGQDPYPSQLTQIEIVAGAIITMRAGFNPGELLDFILGWFNIDIYNDDLEKQNKIEQPPASDRLKAPPVSGGVLLEEMKNE